MSRTSVHANQRGTPFQYSFFRICPGKKSFGNKPGLRFKYSLCCFLDGTHPSSDDQRRLVLIFSGTILSNLESPGTLLFTPDRRGLSIGFGICLMNFFLQLRSRDVHRIPKSGKSRGNGRAGSVTEEWFTNSGTHLGLPSIWIDSAPFCCLRPG